MIASSPRLASLLAALACLACLAGCEPIDVPADAGAHDVGVQDDTALPTDAGVPDAGHDAATDAGPPTAIFVAPGEGDDPRSFFDLPWPSDVRLTAAGTLDLASFPAPTRGLVRTYVTAIGRDQVGFSTMGAVYFRFTHDLDTTTLPATLAQTQASDASVMLVPLIEGAATATHHPVVVRYEPRVTAYWPGRTLALRPADGFPLLPNTRYAAVVTDRVRAVGGGTYRRDADLEAVLAGDSRVASISAIYEPAFEALEGLGVARDEVLSIAVFRTQDPTALLARAVDWVHETMPAPTLIASAWSSRGSTATYNALHGRYSGAPTLQEGVIPYSSAGGAIRADESGVPILQGTYEARFSLAVPVSEMPEDGYPIVLYGHGTGGDFRTVLEDDTAALLAAQGIAAMGIDAPLHGERGITSDGTLFFNVANPDAVRCNPLQAAVDHAAQSVVAASMVVPRSILERDGREVRFDPSRIYYVGHSQGALVGPLFFGVDATPRAALFSAGGTLIGHSLLEKVEPVDIPGLVRSILGFPGATTREAFDNEGFTLEHPIITLIQGWVDASDPGNYAPLAALRPRSGVPARSVVLTEGLRDPYVSPAGMEALATAYQVPIAAPVARDIAGLQFLGISSELGEVRANLPSGVTGALLQFPTEGHFAFFNDTRGRERIGSFFASLLDGGPGTIPGP